MPSEFIVANISGRAKRKKLRGRDYLVAPVSMLVPGVHSGSRGSLFYSQKVIENSVRAWNGMPLTLRHPSKGSARTAEVLESQGLGTVLNATFDEGKLRAEVWVDIKNATEMDPTLISDIENGTPVEVSTGLYSATVTENGDFEGTSYTGKVENLQPDHLAVLRDEPGACSLDDGCGINNSEGEPMTNRTLFEKFLGFVDNLRKDSEGSSATSTSKKEESTMALSTERKKEVVDSLIANCGCYQESDRETLNALDDNELIGKVLSQGDDDKRHEEEETFNKKLEALTAPVDIDENTQMVFNKETNEWEAKAKEKDVKTENKEAPKQLSEEEWLASAPQSVRNAFAHSKVLIENERVRLVSELSEGLEDVENARKGLSEKSLDELKEIAKYRPVQKSVEPAPNFSGRGSFVSNRGVDIEFDREDTIPVLDFMDFEDETAKV